MSAALFALGLVEPAAGQSAKLACGCSLSFDGSPQFLIVSCPVDHMGKVAHNRFHARRDKSCRYCKAGLAGAEVTA